MEDSIEQQQQIFIQKSKRMKETHIVSLEVDIDHLYFNQESTNEIQENADIVKIRVKFANLPCLEINGSFEEDCLALDTASVGTLGRTSLHEISEKDFFRRGRISLASSIIKQESRKKARQDQLKNKKKEGEADKKDEKNKSDKNLTEGKGEDSEKETADSEKEDKKSSQKSEQNQPTDQPSETSVSAKVDCGIPFNDCKAMIFPITPHELLYQLINKPLKLYLIYYFDKSSVELIGQASISLYPLSDIVPHMTLINGGVHSVSKMEGIYPLHVTDLRDCTKSVMGHVKVKLQIASYGISSCAKLSTLGRVSNVKFMTDEFVENLEQETLPQVVRDVNYRLPIITGEEHILVPEVITKTIKLDDKDSGLPYKCVNKWKDILGA